MNDMIINSIKEDLRKNIYSVMNGDLVKCIVFGSCVRGDYNEDSDIDVALLTKSYEDESLYGNSLSDYTMDIISKYGVVISFLCLPYDYYMEHCNSVPLYCNIMNEGELMYG